MTHTVNCNKQWLEHTYFHKFFQKRDGKFIFKGDLLRRLTNPAELSHKWVLANLKYQEPEFYSILFDES